MDYNTLIQTYGHMIPDVALKQIEELHIRCKDHPVKVASYTPVYNHEPFLRECLDGIVMQQTDFPYIAIVHDDASTDGSAAIIREYVEKYPDLFFPIYEEENQYHRPGGPLTYIIQSALAATGCEFVAICEGDDYWTAPNKLQLQADFLSSHPDYSMCTHNYREYIQDSGEFQTYNNMDNNSSQKYDLSLFVHDLRLIYRTLTIVYRRDKLNLQKLFNIKYRCDYVLIYCLLETGDGLFISEYLGIYRKHGISVWSGMAGDALKQFKFNYRFKKALHEVKKDCNSATFLSSVLYTNPVGRKDLIRNLGKLLYILYNSLVYLGIKKTHILIKTIKSNY